MNDFVANSPHFLFEPYDYIQNPKPDGYRSHHLVFKYIGKGDDQVFNGRRIEIQVRTRLQHAWATAVEAVGLFRGEDLKGGNGSADWLRLFQLMSSEFAMAENCPDLPDAPKRTDRLPEIIDLDKRLRAIDTLDVLSQSFQYVEEYIQPSAKPEYFLLEYDNRGGHVTVEPHFNALLGADSYDNAEAKSASTKHPLISN